MKTARKKAQKENRDTITLLPHVLHDLITDLETAASSLHSFRKLFRIGYQMPPLPGSVIDLLEHVGKKCLAAAGRPLTIPIIDPYKKEDKPCKT